MPLTKIKSLGITDGTIVNADINSSAAITYSKLSLGTSIVNADISASAAIDSTKLTGVNDAKAWVNFNGTGTVAIRGSFNVSSITDNGTGNYTVNFTTALSDANYSIAGCAGESSINTPVVFQPINQTAPTTSAVRIGTGWTNGGTNDVTIATVTIFR